MELYLLLRIAKVLSVAALFAGTIGAFFPRALADRRRAAYFLAGPGFGASWASGFGLAQATSQSLLQTWIVAGLALSLFSLQVVLFAVGKDGRRGPIAAALALGALVATVVLMVLRPA